MSTAFEQASPIPYTFAGREYRGQLVHNAAVTRRKPGLLMAPNYLGVTQEAVDRARMLAGDRYVVFVADLRGADSDPDDIADAKAKAGALASDGRATRELMNLALNAFLSDPAARDLLDGNVAAVGFCLGGRNVLELARSGAKLCAAVSIHGTLKASTPAQAGVLSADILAIHASRDPVVPSVQVDGFREEMDACGAHWRLVMMGGLLHAFTDPDVDVPGMAKYDQRAAHESYLLLHGFVQAAIRVRSTVSRDL